MKARDSWLQEQVNKVHETDSPKCLVSYVDLHRAHLFDIVTQYRALFPCNDGRNRVLDECKAFWNGNSIISKDFTDCSVLPCWLLTKVTNVIDHCQRSLNALIDSCHESKTNETLKIASLFEPLLAFSSSMSRIGCDLRPQIIQLIAQFIQQLFELRLGAAIDQFERQLDHYSVPYKELHSLILEDPNDDSNSSKTNESELDTDNRPPPLSLIPFEPLAQLHNDILLVFNQTGQLLPVTCVPRLRECLCLQLTKASSALARYCRTESSGLKASEQKVLQRMCYQYAHVLIPYIRQCFAALCPSVVICNTLAISRLEFARLRNNEPQIDFSDFELKPILDSVYDLIS